MKYQAREKAPGWQVYRIGDDGTEGFVGFAPTEDEVEKMIAADVTARKRPPRVLEFDDDGKRVVARAIR